MNFDIIEILNTYGLPTALALMFVWFYKQSSDKYNDFLKNAIKEQNKKAEREEEILTAIKEVKLSTDELKSATAELHRTIMAYLLKDGK